MFFEDVRPDGAGAGSGSGELPAQLNTARSARETLAPTTQVCELRRNRRFLWSHSGGLPLILTVSLLSEIGFLLPPNRMSVHVARGHRGDGGGEPPRQPHTIPKACDSSKPKRDYKRKVYLTLHNYFDIESFRDTPHWNGIVQGIDADFKASYRRRKSKVYGSSHGAEPYAQKRHKEKKETVMQNHIDGWKKSYFKEGNGWCHPQAQHDWGKIMQEYRKMLEEVDGDDSLVDQTECLKRALGERSSHTRELTQQMSQQFTEQMHQMFLSQNPNAQPPQFQFTFDPSRLQVPNGHDVNEEDEESQGYENEDDEMEEGDQNEEWENSSSGPDN
ncbi:unnamed protein product [Lactuca saligna]|uniref:Transposase, Ptta/En/Spm, plant n=1 Tax=Lactuca saligna TaxID=75948 RepID=A0AA36E7W6_LACSI|nr:unnamed protein product [Lactuca saligna]